MSTEGLETVMRAIQTRASGLAMLMPGTPTEKHDRAKELLRRASADIDAHSGVYLTVMQIAAAMDTPVDQLTMGDVVAYIESGALELVDESAP